MHNACELEQCAPEESCLLFSALGLPKPKSIVRSGTHETTFIDYDGHRPDARNRRVRPIPERDVKPAARGAKPDQRKFPDIPSTASFFDAFGKLDVIDAKRPIDARQP
jgi:hypothetical protein